MLDGQSDRRRSAAFAKTVLIILIVASVVLLIPMLLLLKDELSQANALNGRLASAQLAMRQVSQPPADVVALLVPYESETEARQ